MFAVMVVMKNGKWTSLPYTKDVDNIISMLEVAGTGITFELSLNVILA